MTSSQSLASIELRMIRPMFDADSWLIPEFSRDNDLLTKALQKSISNTLQQTPALESSLPLPLLEPSPAPTVSNASGSSEREYAATKRKRTAAGEAGTGGKISKRRSRTTKRSQTTFITADPANFRQMVQQITGVRYGTTDNGIISPVMKPESQLLCNRLPCGPSDGFQLPMLDTSAFLSDHHQESLVMGPTEVWTGAAAFASYQPSLEVDGGAGAVSKFHASETFPTLESWEDM